MLFIIVILIITSCILLFLLLLQNHEIRNISKQLKEISPQDTNVLIHSNGSGKTSEDLINEINSLFQVMQRSRIYHQQKKHALDQMMTNISHDLRTPLTSAMGYIHIIQNSNLTEEEKSRELAIIEQRLLRLEELINSFFEFSQIISNEKVPEKTALNIISILEESIAHYYDDYCTKNREILFQCRQHKLMVYSNKSMLLRIFDNLVNNALKHGVCDLTISVDAVQNVSSGETVQIVFKNKLTDSNIDTNHIFDEFYTTDISRTKGNTGLGLAIVKEFTEILNGSVSAQYSDGLLSMTVLLPTKSLKK